MANDTSSPSRPHTAPDAEAEMIEAYRNYLVAAKAYWATVDPGAIEARDLQAFAGRSPVSEAGGTWGTAATVGTAGTGGGCLGTFGSAGTMGTWMSAPDLTASRMNPVAAGANCFGTLGTAGTFGCLGGTAACAACLGTAGSFVSQSFQAR